MIKRLFQWVKQNKLTSILALVAIYFLYKNYTYTHGPLFGYVRNNYYGGVMMDTNSAVGAPVGMGRGFKTSGMTIPETEIAPVPSITDRKMITSSYIALQVKSVTDGVESLKAKVSQLQGYLVNINLSRPEVGETASVQLRIPSDKVEDMIKHLRGMAIKVVSEDISGSDITDEYIDIQGRLGSLQKTRARMETIQDQAVKIEDIVNIQNQIFRIQDQIDTYMGRLKYLDGASSTTLITVYMSTDETGLPYTEPLSWRPEVVFKHAVRSLIATLQKAGSAFIWLGVYSVILIPAATLGLIILIIAKRRHQG